MLFNSFAFLFVFLPVTLAAFYICRLWSRRAALSAVAALSLVFYAIWDPRYLALLVPSLVVNYVLGELIDRTRSRAWLLIGIAANLSVIGWFKYSAFFYSITIGDPPDFMRGIVLPLGISFITFQKIAYLVDIWRGYPKARSFDRFAFFVLFFPQLIAGPIVLFRNIDRQIQRGRHDAALLRASFQLGLILFAIGLFKKVVIADSMAQFADVVFRFSERAGANDPGFLDAWIGAVTYSLQLYFDFSGYSDMAIGLARMFGFRLPTNFNSPYQATSIIDFWRRWHMTLSSFFRDYVYSPLGGNRRGLGMQAAFVMIVFFLTGLWHGAGWTFIAWGTMHGVLVLGNHLWTKLTRWRMPAIVGWGLTLPAVVTLWVVFRATSLASAAEIVSAMWTPGHLTTGAIAEIGIPYIAYVFPVGVMVAAVTMPSSTVLAHRLRHGHLRARSTNARPIWWLPAAVTGAAMYLAISSIGNIQSKFIYFNF